MDIWAQGSAPPAGFLSRDDEIIVGLTAIIRVRVLACNLNLSPPAIDKVEASISSYHSMTKQEHSWYLVIYS